MSDDETTLPSWAHAWEPDPDRPVVAAGETFAGDGMPWMVFPEGGGRPYYTGMPDGAWPAEGAYVPIRLRSHGEALARVAALEAQAAATGGEAETVGYLVHRNGFDGAGRGPYVAQAYPGREMSQWDESPLVLRSAYTAALARAEAAEAQSSDLRGRLATMEGERDALALELAQARDLSASMTAILQAYPVEAIAEWRGRAERAEARLAEIEAWDVRTKAAPEPDVSEGSIALEEVCRGK